MHAWVRLVVEAHDLAERAGGVLADAPRHVALGVLCLGGRHRAAALNGAGRATAGAAAAVAATAAAASCCCPCGADENRPQHCEMLLHDPPPLTSPRTHGIGLLPRG